MTVSGRAGYDYCGYGEECVCAPHGPCDCRDDDLGPFDQEHEMVGDEEEARVVEVDAERSEYGVARRLALLRGGRLVEITGEPFRETR